jgi:hypothetical protein
VEKKLELFRKTGVFTSGAGIFKPGMENLSDIYAEI